MSDQAKPAQQPPFVGASGSAISVFATMPDGSRRWEQYASRKEAAAGIRDCRSKGGTDFNIFDPWMPKQPPNAE